MISQRFWAFRFEFAFCSEDVSYEYNKESRLLIDFLSHVCYFFCSHDIMFDLLLSLFSFSAECFFLSFTSCFKPHKIGVFRELRVILAKAFYKHRRELLKNFIFCQNIFSQPIKTHILKVARNKFSEISIFAGEKNKIINKIQRDASIRSKKRCEFIIFLSTC